MFDAAAGSAHAGVVAVAQGGSDRRGRAALKALIAEVQTVQNVSRASIGKCAGAAAGSCDKWNLALVVLALDHACFLGGLDVHTARAKGADKVGVHGVLVNVKPNLHGSSCDSRAARCSRSSRSASSSSAAVAASIAS